MALHAPLNLPGGASIPGGYHRLMSTLHNRLHGVLTITTWGFASPEARKAGADKVTHTEVEIRRPMRPVPTGKDKTTGPAVLTYPDVMAKPLSAFMAVPPGVTTAQELLDRLTYNDVDAALVYGVLKLSPQFAGAKDV